MLTGSKARDRKRERIKEMNGEREKKNRQTERESKKRKILQ